MHHLCAMDAFLSKRLLSHLASSSAACKLRASLALVLIAAVLFTSLLIVSGFTALGWVKSTSSDASYFQNLAAATPLTAALRSDVVA